MRITWYSNAPWAPSGYGQQTADVVRRLIAAGHPTAVAANYALHETALEWHGIPVLPAGKDKSSNDIVRAHHMRWRGDWLITLYDAWPLNRKMFPERVASWIPIDHDPIPPAVAEWCRTVRPAAMSRFGQRKLREVGIDAAYIPHAIDTSVFKPTDTLNERPTREVLGIPADAFLVMIVAANKGMFPSRKAWPEMFDALGQFMAEHPDAWLYVHTDVLGNGGLDLSRLAKVKGLPADRLRWAEAYDLASGNITQATLAARYSAADVLLASSMGEGFGIPVIEAQACGLPVIVSDFSAQPELCESGWLVEGQRWWDEAKGQGESHLFTPFIHSIVDRLNDAYAARGDNGLRERAVAFAAAYDSALVFERYWLPFLAELQAGLEPVPMNRAERRRRKKAAA